MTFSLVLLIGGLILYAMLHSLLLAPPVHRRMEKLVPRRFDRLAYNAIAIVLFGALWQATESSYPLVWDVHGAGAILLRGVQAGAVLLFLLALWPLDLLHFLGLRQLRGAPGKEPRLITQGAYALCRHPLYLAACVFFSAWPRMDLRWLIVAIWIWLYCLVGSVFEERRLEAQFGAAYRIYRRSCPRLLPFRFGSPRRS